MYSGSDRIKALATDIILDDIDIEVTDEVIIRRFVSAMYRCYSITGVQLNIKIIQGNINMENQSRLMISHTQNSKNAWP